MHRASRRVLPCMLSRGVLAFVFLGFFTRAASGQG
jgi:hypothetical protein